MRIKIRLVCVLLVAENLSCTFFSAYFHRRYRIWPWSGDSFMDFRANLLMVLCVIFELEDTLSPGNTHFLKLVYLDLERVGMVCVIVR